MPEVLVLEELIKSILASYTLGSAAGGAESLQALIDEIRANGFTPAMDEMLLQYYPQLRAVKEAFSGAGQLTLLFYRTVIETAADQYSITNVGLAAKATVKSVFNAVGAALGLTITEELPEEKYVEVLDNLGVDVTDTTDIMITNDGTAEAPTYRAHISEEQLKDYFRAMWDAGFFATGGVVHTVPTASGAYTVATHGPITKEQFLEVFGKAFSLNVPLPLSEQESLWNIISNKGYFENVTDIVLNATVDRGVLYLAISLITMATPYIINIASTPAEDYAIVNAQDMRQVIGQSAHTLQYYVYNGALYPEKAESLGYMTSITASQYRQNCWIGEQTVVEGVSYSTSTIGTISMPGITGVLVQDGATLPASEVLNIDELFGGWASRAKTVTNIDEFGELVDYRMLPIDIGLADTAVGTLDRTQAVTQEGVLSHVGDEVIAGSLAEALTGTYVDVFDRTKVKTLELSVSVPTGDTPPILLPLDNGSAGLFTVYNPSRSQLDSIASFMWQSTILSQIQQMFQSAYDAVISLHEIFVTPNTLGSDYIHYGGLVFSQDTATGKVPLVSSRYVQFAYPPVNVYGLYANSYDYDPYVSISLYLPFIGTVQLNTGDVMDSTLTVSYVVDVVTGCTVAQIFVTKYESTQLLYTFEGNCSMQLPVTGREHVLKSELALVGTALATASALSGGGALAGLTAIQGLGSAGAVQLVHKGNISSNAGAVNPRVPYLIINHQNEAMAEGYYNIEGGSASETIKLGDCHGFTKVKSVHLDGIACTTTEKQEIEALLMGGVIL